MPVPKQTFDAFFSCFSTHPVAYQGVQYLTAEHAYQAQRYTDPSIISEICAAPTAKDAWAVSQKYKHQQLPDFTDRKREVMKEILKAKLAQHQDIQEALSLTGNEEIVKEVPEDAYWGTGPDGNGRNELGKLWMELRSEMKSA